MKKFILSLLFSFTALNIAYSQLITEKEFDEAEEKYLPDVKLKERSHWLFNQGWFSNEGLPMYSTIIEVDTSLTKDQIWVSAYQTIISSFNEPNVITKLNDREAGSFIVEGLFWGWGVSLSSYTGGMSYVACQIRVDIKKGKVRCIAIPQYILQKWIDGYGQTFEGKQPIFKKPYTEGYDKAIGKTRSSAKIYLRTYIWTQIIMDRLAKHVTVGASGIENDDW